MRTFIVAFLVLAGLAGLFALFSDEGAYAECTRELASCVEDCDGDHWCAFKCVLKNGGCLAGTLWQ
ncbi:hypothetical protein FACS1894186_3780 [Alphaproteobacteria bacterium]|nr:hypothetical protein FACS1894186_3780 [Alphaproteobacteria bacterium]